MPLKFDPVKAVADAVRTGIVHFPAQNHVRPISPLTMTGKERKTKQHPELWGMGDRLKYMRTYMKQKRAGQ
jgi:hypothetical protein